MFSLSAHADSYRGYLKIDCAPSIGHFSVRPTGTWAFDADAPDGFIPLDFGQSYDTESSEWVKKEGSDLFAICEIPGYFVSKNQKGLTFKVIRTAAYKPANCSGCAFWKASFSVTLNDKEITSGRVGRSDMRPMDSISFDGEEIQICQSLVRNGYRSPNEEGRYDLSCEIKTVRDFLTSK